MWSPVNIAKVGLDSSDGEDDEHSPPLLLSQATAVPRSKRAVESIEREEGGDRVISGPPPPQATTPQTIEIVGVTRDEVAQGKGQDDIISTKTIA